MGRQPFGLASPAAWLRRAGHEVFTHDLAVQPPPAADICAAGLIALYLPMHTATRLAAGWIPRLRRLNPRAHFCAFGLYAPLNAAYLSDLGVQTIIGGEFEQALTQLADYLAGRSVAAPAALQVVHDRLPFFTPDRSSLPPLARYARLHVHGQTRLVGYTEASRGCKHACRHCPVVPVYRGRFRIVQPETVLADIRQQVSAGARHITFGDPDFFNGPAHARRLIETLHAEFPELTYDVTIKVSHLLAHRHLLPLLVETGCLFVTTAVESFQDSVLQRLNKGHSVRDFLLALELVRRHQLALCPTFIAFTPWTTPESYRDFLRMLAELDLVDSVAPIQLALRLLIPHSSALLELPEIRACISPFDPAKLLYPWTHPNAQVDHLADRVLSAVAQLQRAGRSRREIFNHVWELAHGAPPPPYPLRPRATIPFLDEPWYC
jgi:radical SAM superfamily enzyme YgiQ (UPF0313 family)